MINTNTNAPPGDIWGLPDPADPVLLWCVGPLHLAPVREQPQVHKGQQGQGELLLATDLASKEIPLTW